MSGVLGKPVPDREERASRAHAHRVAASSHAEQRGTARTVANGEELAFGDTFAANFHKGLPHSPAGFVEPSTYRGYVDALLNQDHGRFEALPTGDNFPETTYPRRTTGATGHRKLTSPFAGHVYDLEGADAGALAIPPAPPLESDELAAELAELYVMALLRDTSFADIAAGGGPIDTLVAALSSMPWFSGTSAYEPIGSRRRPIKTASDLFRGSTAGSRNGPWVSQFLLVGSVGPTTANVSDGYVQYGTQVVDQRSVVAKAAVDWLQTWPSWLDAQNGVNFGGKDDLQAARAFLTTPRDVATYVHYDALYQAYQVACLLMISDGAPFGFDRGLVESGSRTRLAFSSFGGPHILSLVTEVATRALKQVWRQKWLHHRRLRPEVAAGLVALFANDPVAIPHSNLKAALTELHDKIPPVILAAIAAKNADPAAKSRIPANGNTAGLPTIADAKNYLLPMAFPEGSPTHPAYGAGHATVAGACVTILKAFFEMYQSDGVSELKWPLLPNDGPHGGKWGFGNVYQGNGAALQSVPGAPQLTVQGELDKLAANIAVARNIAGVHYYTDYFASLRQGERVSVSILEEQAALFNEPFSMSLTSFDGDRIRVRGHNGTATVSIVDRDGHTVAPADWYQRYSS